MVVSSARRLLTATALMGLSIGLAGCMGGTTYGTGKSPGTQTLEDLAGIASMGGPKKEPIEYGMRAPLVPPPPGTPLPPPGSQTTVATNWPKDPDVEQKKFKAESQARAAAQVGEQPYGANGPQFRLPPKAQSDEPNPILVDPNKRKAEEEAHTTPQQVSAAKKLFADSRGVPTDENGQPIRQYLTDPPSAYRAPDPNAPVEIEAKPAAKKKFKWPWQ